ncbi:MAG: trypsin-like peptidase domain-containing protein [Pirellulaceae bacterium]|nr:trypsin-like peptidase domain-containing protein [Pirellulaceae bacterium]
MNWPVFSHMVINARWWQTCVWLALAQVMLASTSVPAHAQTADKTDVQPVEAEAKVIPDGLAILASIEQATIAAIEKAEQSVVAITRVRKNQAAVVRAEQLIGPKQLPFWDTPDNPEFVPTEFASGVIVSTDGMIVTCAHALDDPQHYQYYVWLDRRAYEAEVVAKSAKVQAADPYTDLAVLKIEASNLSPITFGDADQLRKGSFVISLGNPYATARDGQASASWGIVANLQRTGVTQKSNESSLLAKENQHQFGTLIQTDARLNLGTSGGALVNLRGEMVGLTTSLAALSGFEQSAGYAIAVDDMFKRVVDALKTGHQPEFGFLGIQPEELRAHERAAGFSGARVSLVLPGLPGDLAGLRNEDCIVEINSQPIEDRNGLFRELSQLPAGAEVDLTVQRPRRGEVPFTPIHLKAKLSKKFISTSRPAFAIHAPQQWRGMLVEYSTAVPSELVRGGQIAQRRTNAKLAILSVDPDSPAWRAGLRAGHTILAINGTRVLTPDEFYKHAQDTPGPAVVQVYRSSDRLETLSIAEF